MKQKNDQLPSVKAKDAPNMRVHPMLLKECKGLANEDGSTVYDLTNKVLLSYLKRRGKAPKSWCLE